MIQKIRSYLLDNEGHKDSIGWYVVIIMLAPIIGIIFQYRKNVTTYVGIVNNGKIEKSIFNIKLFEQNQMMENLTKMFGKEQSLYFFDMLLQGKTLEQYVLSNEIKRVFLQELFKKLISKDNISGDYIMSNFKKKSLDKIRSMIGELSFLLITGQLKPNAFGSLNIDIKKIDNYCEEVFQVNFLNTLFLAPLATIEKLIFNHYPSLPLSMNVISYRYDLNQSYYKKKVDTSLITENEMRFMYDLDIKKFQKARFLKCNISIYEIKEKEIKPNEKNSALKKKWGELSADVQREDLSANKKLLDSNFNCKKINNELAINFMTNDEEPKVISSSIALSKEVKEKLIAWVLEKKQNIIEADKCFVLVDGSYIYLIKDFSLSSIAYDSFEDVKPLVINLIVNKRSTELLKLDLDRIRYDLEAGISPEVSLEWKKEEKKFIKDSQDKKFSDLILSKISAGGLRKGNTFVEFLDDSYTLYFVSDLTYEENNDNNFIIRKDQFYNKDIFIESIERHAKIEIINE